MRARGGATSDVPTQEGFGALLSLLQSLVLVQSSPSSFPVQSKSSPSPGPQRKMFIYFCGSIRGGRDDVHVYRRIVEILRTYGTVLTEHVTDDRLTDKGESSEMGDKQIHDRDLDWLKQSDVVVAEVTQPSLGVGYELGRAVEMNKRVLCLFRPDSGRRLSAMIRGAEDGQRFIVQDYSQDQVQNILTQFFSQKQD